MSLKIAITSDHAGYRYKEKIKEHLTSMGYQVKDFGQLRKPVDYPLFIRPAAEAVPVENVIRAFFSEDRVTGKQLLPTRSEE